MGYQICSFRPIVRLKGMIYKNYKKKLRYTTTRENLVLKLFAPSLNLDLHSRDQVVYRQFQSLMLTRGALRDMGGGILI
jgi:hypothetical protein